MTMHQKEKNYQVKIKQNTSGLISEFLFFFLINKKEGEV